MTCIRSELPPMEEQAPHREMSWRDRAAAAAVFLEWVAVIAFVVAAVFLALARTSEIHIMLLLASTLALALAILISLVAWKVKPLLAGGIGFILIFLALPKFLTQGGHGSTDLGAVSKLRTINVAEITYLSSSGGRYGTIEQLVQDGLLGDHFGSDRPVDGYTFKIVVTQNGEDYVATATPMRKQGRYAYYSGPDVVVRYTTNPALAPQNAAGEPVQ